MSQYLSDDGQKNFSGLTPEEAKRLAELSAANPDRTDRQSTLSCTPEFQRVILAAVGSDSKVAAKAMPHLRPEHFADRTLGDLYGLLKGHWQEFGSTPTRITLDELVRDRWPDSVPHRAMVATVFDNYESEVQRPAEVLAQVQKFCRINAVRMQYAKEIDIACGPGTDAEKWAKYTAARQSFSLPDLSGSAGLFSDWGQVTEVADGQHEDWLVPNWSEFGCVTLFSSLPKLGKSTIIAELVASAMVGRDFYGLPLNGSPVLLVDPENREKTLVRRITSALGGDGPGKMPQWFFRMNAFPKPLALDRLRESVKQIKERTGEDRVIVVLDTLRSCFCGAMESENDNTEMTQVLTPLKDFAAETNSAVLLIHHHSKGSDSYAGGTAVLSNVDYFWNWQNDRKGVGELTCWGRGDVTEPLYLKHDHETRRNVVSSKGKGETGKTWEGDKKLMTIPYEPDPGVTVHQLAAAWAVSRRTADKHLRDYREDGLVKVRQPTDVTQRLTYYRPLNPELAA